MLLFASYYRLLLASRYLAVIVVSDYYDKSDYYFLRLLCFQTSFTVVEREAAAIELHCTALFLLFLLCTCYAR